MRRSSNSIAGCIAVILLALSMMWGCDDDCPVCPDPTITATIDNIWPNADGNWWQYEYSLRSWDQEPITFVSEIDVPPAPMMDDIVAILGTHPIGPNATVLDRRYQLRFDSLRTTASGVIAQNLEQLIYDPPLVRAPIQPVHGEEGLYLRILAARPDLRDAFLPFLRASNQEIPEELLTGGFKTPGQIMDLGPILIHDGAWWKTTEWIGTYGDLDQRLAWKFLESNLTPGAEFTYQLIPSLAGDVWLHCRVTHKVNVNTPAGSFTGALEFVYLIDYGIQEYVLVTSTVYARPIDFGSVVYVPEYGPVYCYERNFVYVGTDTLGAGYGDRTFLLMDSNLIDG